MKTQEKQRKKRITEWTWRMEGWCHWWTIAQWCQSAPDHLRLCWINADIPVIVDLIIEIILQYQNEKESDVIMDQTTFIFFWYLTEALIQKHKAGQSFTVLFGDTTPAVSGIEHVTFGRSNHSAPSFTTYLPTTAQVLIQDYATVVLPLQAHVQPKSDSCLDIFFFFFLSFGDQTSIFFMWDFHFSCFFLFSPVIIDQLDQLDHWEIKLKSIIINITFPVLRWSHAHIYCTRVGLVYIFSNRFDTLP